MKGVEGVKLIKEIEQNYDVMSIKFRGVSVWPFLRLYFKDSVSSQRETKASPSVVGLVFRCLFAYNPFRAFKRHDIWSFTACERRKQLGEKMIHRISGAFASENLNCLMIEKPLKGVGHYSLEKIEEKDIISESWLLMAFHAMEVLSRVRQPKLDNEQLLIRILNEHSIMFNYKRYVRILNSQRLALKILVRLTSKPKVAMMECPYDTMGYMWAFHELGVKVVEMQHGTLNGKHFSYNAKDYEPILNPDCICVFGKTEYSYLTEKKPQYAPEVRMTGLFMLELADKFFINDIFAEERKVFNAIIVVSGQPYWEEPLAQFVDSAAVEHENLLFVYIPRRFRDDLSFSSPNVRLVNGVNIYEYLKWSDIHVTITSTTCLEAQYFRTPTIFYNFENHSRNYFNNDLSEENGFEFVDNPQEFDEAYNRIINNRKMEFGEFFVHNHVKRLLDVVNESI